ncbi:hypothetical protein BGX21_004453 [Mortierella sp. AD011]|nr:hypothetical protein BGX20_003782 [Mortierella sp. AD010]KAF9403411.1 hypothetical protein BGX21_004453 [Mortierella sp. AD011]
MYDSYPFGSQQGPASLRRETTEDISKMYTTLYDMEDPIQQQEYALLQSQRQQESQAYFDTLMSPALPASPASDCFSSSSSSSGSAYPSPIAALVRSMDPDEADELVESFNITIEDLLSEDPLSFDYSKELDLDSAADFDLFEPQGQVGHIMHSHCSFTSGGPIRSSSMSPNISCAPYATVYNQHQIEHIHNIASSPLHFHSEMPNSPTSTSTASPSLSPCPSPSVSSTPCMSPLALSTSTFASPSTTAVATTPSSPSSAIPNTDGMTVIKNDDGSIMVYNPATESMTFRCELCPGDSFGRIHDLKRHQASKHQATTWPCEFCHRPFARRDALLRHYTVKSQRDDGLHPASHEKEKLLAARAKAKLIK